MIKVVFFDVGGTLIKPYPSVGAVYAAVAERHGVSVRPEVLNERFKDSWLRQKERRKLVDKAWWRVVVDDVFSGHRFAHPETFFNELYAAFERPESWMVFDDVEPALTALKQRGLRLAVLSNWDDRLPALLAALKLERYFEKQFISCKLGCVKPDRKFFVAAIEGMRVDPLEAIHIGDDPNEDVAGAQNIGMRAYLLDRTRKPRNSRELVQLTEVLDRI